jgi:hypothetical protein
MSAAEDVPRTPPPSSPDDTAADAGDRLTPTERSRLAKLVAQARQQAFPGSLGVPENRIGESDQQDFYFRELLDLLCANVSALGVPAVAGSIDDLWRYTGEAFERWTARGKNRFSRETTRQIAVHQWPRAFERVSRIYSHDTRTFDDDAPTTPVKVRFSYTPPTEASPFVLSAAVSDFALDSGTIVSIDSTTVPRACWLPAIEDAVIPTNRGRQAEYADVLLAAVLRLLPPEASETARHVRRLRPKSNAHGKTAATARLDPDVIARLQAALAGFRSGSSADMAAALQHLDRLQVRDADLRHGHDLIDALDDVAPEDRQTILASLALMVRAARKPLATALLVVIVFLLIFISPTKAGAAIRRLVQRLFDRIVIGSIVSDVTVDPQRNLFVTPDGRAAPELLTQHDSWLKIAPSVFPGGRNLHLSLSQADQREFANQVQLLTQTNTHLLGAQYRLRPNGPVVPWVAEFDLVPPQDATLASEVAAREATAAFTVTPAPEPSPLVASSTIEDPNGEITTFIRAYEFAHHAATYSVTATVSRPHRAAETYGGTITFDAHGAATMIVPSGPPVQPVRKLVADLMPSCTTLVPLKTILAAALDTGEVAAAAVVGDEQRVTFSIMVPDEGTREYVIDFGDGSKALRKRATGPGHDLVTHVYGQGDRAYTVTVYGDRWSYVFRQKALYVFAQHPRAALRVYAYTTPYEPFLAAKAQELIRSRDLPRILYKQPDGRLWMH